MNTELLQIVVPLLVISLVLNGLLMSKAKVMKPFKKLSLIYLLLSGLSFAVVGLVGFLYSFVNFNYLFHLIGLLFLGLGVLNHFMAKYYLPWYENANFIVLLTFNVIIATFGSLMYIIAHYYISGIGTGLFNLFNVAYFFVPFLLFQSISFYFGIPDSEYKKWYYPFGKEINDPTEHEMESPLVIAFMFQKRFDNYELTTFRAMAPRQMKFGKLFYHFIVDYNAKYNDSKIEYIYDRSKSYGWIFYMKQGWLARKVYIDPDKTVAENQIEEDSVIIAQRVLE